jgi:hypothetical protein
MGGFAGARDSGVGRTAEPEDMPPLFLIRICSKALIPAACAFDRPFCSEGAAGAFCFPVSGESDGALRLLEGRPEGSPELEWGGLVGIDFSLESSVIEAVGGTVRGKGDRHKGYCATLPNRIGTLRSGDPFWFRCWFADKEHCDRLKNFKHVVCQFGQHWSNFSQRKQAAEFPLSLVVGSWGALRHYCGRSRWQW